MSDSERDADKGDADKSRADKSRAGKSGADKSRTDKGPTDKSRADDSRSESEEAFLYSAESKEGMSFTVTGGGLLKALAVLVALALVVACAVLGIVTSKQNDRLDAFDESKAASEEFVVALISTLNTSNAGNMKEILGPLSTGALRGRLEQETTQTEDQVSELQITASADIASTSVEYFDGQSARTTVMAQVTGRSATAPQGGTNLMIFLLDLNKEDGQWLVSAFNGPPGSEQSGVVDPSHSLPGADEQPAPAEQGEGEQGEGEQQAPAPEPAPAPGG